ncbi:MAG TPA: helix-turn-helix transcriptional regulator [Actinocrinis sp.]|jgi:transcriptional regulator with XRE-family HTH domain
MASLPGPKQVAQLGTYIREQRENAQYSLRQLAQAAGVSNPYLSQIERGLRKPSAEILQQLAKALKISAETLYIQAGLLDERLTGERRTGESESDGEPGSGWSGLADFVAPNGVARAASSSAVAAAVNADRDLTHRQKQILLDIYESFRAAPGAGSQDATNAARRTRRADENSQPTEHEGGRS